MFPQTKLFILAGLAGLAILPLACHKRVLVIPEPCVTAGKTDIKRTDTLVLTDCSRAAEQTQLFIFKSSAPVPDPDHFVSFNAQHQNKHVFADTGSYTVLVRAINKEVPLQESKLQVTVRE